MATEAAPEWLEKGDNAWQLAAAALVGLQSVPGLVILYGGIVKKKWAVNSAFMALYAFAATMVCWCLWGFRMSFGDRLLPFVGRPDFEGLDGAGFLSAQGFAGAYPAATLLFFQSVFAAITLILVAGSLLGRMNFRAWMLFVPLWLTFSYTAGAFSVWSPNGFLFKAGVMDFAGEFVIHLSSGVAGFTAAFWVGPRTAKDREAFPPNNILLTLAGAGLLWMGWTGFNGGAPYAANIDASVAVVNTHLCTATSLLVWLILDSFVFGRPSAIGAVNGMITGLVCITPAAGPRMSSRLILDTILTYMQLITCSMQGWAAMLMGLLSGSVPWFTMMVMHKRCRILKHVDDTLAILHTHGVAGSLGGILTGVLAEPRLCRLFFGDDPRYVGLAYAIRGRRAHAGLRQIAVQLAGIAFIVALNVVVTTVVCLLVGVAVPLRLSEEQLAVGDDAIHGEDAYAVWGDGETYQQSVHGSPGYKMTANPMSSKVDDII